MHGWNGWNMGGMWFWWVFIFFIVVAAISFFVVFSRRNQKRMVESPEQIVKRRFAKGEITRETYNRMLSDLRE